jgi:hypothetical protein
LVADYLLYSARDNPVVVRKRFHRASLGALGALDPRRIKMGANYLHISETLKGVSNEAVFGFFSASAEEWEAFFASSAKWRTPPGVRVGPNSEKALTRAFQIHRAAASARVLAEADAFSHPYFHNYPSLESFLSSEGYRWHFTLSPVTGERVKYFAKSKIR